MKHQHKYYKGKIRISLFPNEKLFIGFQDFFFPGLQIKTHSSSMQTAEVNFTQLLGTGFFVTRGGIPNY